MLARADVDGDAAVAVVLTVQPSDGGAPVELRLSRAHLELDPNAPPPTAAAAAAARRGRSPPPGTTHARGAAAAAAPAVLQRNVFTSGDG